MVPGRGRTLEHLALHLVDVLLRIFNHLDCLFPLLDESRLRLLDLLLLDLDPSVDLLLLELEGPRRELVLLEQLLDVAPLLLLLVFEVLFAELDELRMLAVLHDVLQLLLGVLLEGVPVEERVARLARSIIQLKTVRGQHAKLLDAAGLNRRVRLLELVVALRHAVGGQRVLRLVRLVKVHICRA